MTNNAPVEPDESVLDNYEPRWKAADLASLRDLREREQLLPDDAPRALLSVRLSVRTDESTSPERQELDMRRKALDKGHRVVAVVYDVGTSATKYSPWERKGLGPWITDRAPQFDSIIVWKLDRLIRSLSDLNRMIEWANKYKKRLVSVQEEIDISGYVGQLMLTVLGIVAEMEASNTRDRVTSTWAYTKTSSEWNTGKPPFGYRVVRDEKGTNRLAIHDEQAAALRDIRERIIAGETCAAVITDLISQGRLPESVTSWSMNRRLRNPALLGYRVEKNGDNSKVRSRIVYGHDGEPIRVGDPIFTQEEFDELQKVLDTRTPNRQLGSNKTRRSRFLDVIKCADCDQPMRVQITNQKSKGFKEYAYLRCFKGCKAGGPGVHPDAIYKAVEDTVLARWGDKEVLSREYAQGEQARKRIETLQTDIAHYMRELEVGGQYSRLEFTRKQAQATLAKKIAELESIDPDSTEDRWEYVSTGMTFRQFFETGGTEAMEEALSRAGAEVFVSRTKIKGKRAPEVKLKVRLPDDIERTLALTGDDFSADFI